MTELLINELMALSPDEKAVLAHRLLKSIENFADSEIEQAWLEETEKRWREIENGKVRCVPADEAIQNARKGLNKCM